ncbi:hypothetical protein KBA63_01965 [Candidatus Woesebacteria bacterium]|jgi:hypothetical protein|nr:hypothetical protein [Candidatus Woesebacteria bacterium]
MAKGIKDMPVVTKDQIIAIFRRHGQKGLTYNQVCQYALNNDNPPHDVCQESVKPNYMALCQSGKLVKGEKGIRVLVGEVQKKPVVPPHHVNDVPALAPIPVPKPALNELNATVFGVNFTPVRRGKIAPMYVKLLRPVTIEAKPLRFEYAVVWVGPGKDIDTSQWTVVGQVEGSRILLSDEAPDFTAWPYTLAYIKLFVADNGRTDEGIYSIAQLTPEWITWIGSLEKVK